MASAFLLAFLTNRTMGNDPKKLKTTFGVTRTEMGRPFRLEPSNGQGLRISGPKTQGGCRPMWLFLFCFLVQKPGPPRKWLPLEFFGSQNCFDGFPYRSEGFLELCLE